MKSLIMSTVLLMSASAFAESYTFNTEQAGGQRIQLAAGSTARVVVSVPTIVSCEGAKAGEAKAGVDCVIKQVAGPYNWSPTTYTITINGVAVASSLSDINEAVKSAKAAIAQGLCTAFRVGADGK